MPKVTIKYKSMRDLLFIDWFYDLPSYVVARLSVIFLYTSTALELFFSQINDLKKALVSRIFWGRGGLYKNAFHIFLTVFTATFVLVGLLNRFSISSEDIQALELAYGASANSDMFQQGGILTTVVALDQNQANYTVYNHLVVEGDTLDSISTQYSVTKDTIRWANDSLLGPYSESVKVGWNLKIPQMNGVLYTVKSGDTVDTILGKVQNSNRFDIAELNNLVPPNYELTVGQQIFVPNGTIVKPPLIPQATYSQYYGGTGYIPSGVQPYGSLPGFPAGSFDDPLTHPSCGGYLWMRGFVLGWHTGVDLSKGGGCPIRAIAAGTVTFAGWSGTGGFAVYIDHGNGVTSEYLHGRGDIWVRKGSYVAKGQEIMYMGSSGNSTGTHLHLTLRYNGQIIDPAPYVPYRRR